MAVAQPTDVVKVRFQAQARAGAGRRYQSTVEAYKTIAREEGFRGLWKGVYQLFSLPCLPLPLLPGLTWTPFPPVGTSPNVARNAIVNCAELVTYDLIKDTLLKAYLMTGELGKRMLGLTLPPNQEPVWIHLETTSFIPFPLCLCSEFLSLNCHQLG